MKTILFTVLLAAVLTPLTGYTAPKPPPGAADPATMRRRH
jgi:hypothetical protein